MTTLQIKETLDTEAVLAGESLGEGEFCVSVIAEEYGLDIGGAFFSWAGLDAMRVAAIKKAESARVTKLMGESMLAKLVEGK